MNKSMDRADALAAKEFNVFSYHPFREHDFITVIAVQMNIQSEELSFADDNLDEYRLMAEDERRKWFTDHYQVLLLHWESWWIPFCWGGSLSRWSPSIPM